MLRLWHSTILQWNSNSCHRDLPTTY
jgi:hypothetical protein